MRDESIARGASSLLILRSIAQRCVSKDEATGRRARRLRQQPQPQILRHVRVLVLVDQDELEALLILPQHVRMLAEQADAFEQQVAEVGGVERLQPLLIRLIELLALAVGEGRRLAGRHLLGRQAAVLPAVDQRGEHARRPALLVELLDFEELLHQPDLVVDVEDGEVGPEADQLGVAAQDLHADRVEGAHPRHALDRLADHGADAVLHLARRLVGEGDGEDLGGVRAAEHQDVGDARGQDAGLAGAGAGQHQNGAVERLDRGALLRVEFMTEGHVSGTRSHRPRPNPAGGGQARWNGVVTLRIGHCFLKGKEKRRSAPERFCLGQRWHSCRAISRCPGRGAPIPGGFRGKIAPGRGKSTVPPC